VDWTIEKAFNAPLTQPNGIAGTDEGLWIVDQITDFAFLVTEDGELIRCIPTWSENSSGLTFGDGALWVSDNNGRTGFRPPLPTDRRRGGLIKVDPVDGRKLAEFDLPLVKPDQAGIHGLVWTEGTLWLHISRKRVFARVKADDFTVLHTIPILHNRAHGLEWKDDHLWATYTNDRIIVKQDPQDGHAVEIIKIPDAYPNPHGLTWWRGSFWYTNAEGRYPRGIYRIISRG
jgi:hypothetical protein